jgi:hypothetical protein
MGQLANQLATAAARVALFFLLMQTRCFDDHVFQGEGDYQANQLRGLSLK